MLNYIIRINLFAAASLIGMPGVGSALSAGADEATVSFSSEILPLLSDRCFLCHGPDETTREAELRLDQQQSAMQSVIVAGQPDNSELISRIFETDPDLVMPPPSSRLSLTDAEKQKLRRWVEEGAPWDQHWAFVPPPESVEPPAVDHVEWVSNDIDRFVLAGLESRGVLPAQHANRETLLRRVTFDLTGLPPSIDEIDAFVQDAGSDDDALARVVDRLLSSAHYGERLAVDWLDVARYADTHGYQNDRYREMWPWRDWVVSAFNQNLPYDDFITWQLAGDLLPDPKREQILATAFNRNHRQTNEGGSIEEEFRVEYVADRVNTFGAAFLGLTLECCRCHDHKYDPITQQEYYQLSAFFNSIDESGLYSHFTDAVPTPALLLATEAQDLKLAAARGEVQAAEARRVAVSSQAESRYKAWLTQQDGNTVTTDRGIIGHFKFESLAGNAAENTVDPKQGGRTSDNPQSVAGKIGNGVLLSGDNVVSVPSGGEFSRDDPFSVSLWMRTPRRFDRAVVFHRSRAWTDSASQGYELLIEDGRLSAALIHFWPGDAIRVQALDELPVDEWVQVTVTYDGSSRAAGLQLFTNGKPAATTIVRDHLTRQIRGGVKQLALGQRFRDVGFKDGLLDELRVYNVRLTPLEVRALYRADTLPADEAALPIAQLEEDENLFAYYLAAFDSDYRQALGELRMKRVSRSQAIDPLRSVMVMRELPEPRATWLLTRGAYDARSERVFAETPQSLTVLSEQFPRNRLGLARWLTSADHPLTSRVTVNRFWQMLFGRGLVATSEDFGRQGVPPSHPRLLDYLSRRFMQSGWDVKGLLKEIVMSSTYRQDSDCPPALRQQDPENVWLARGPAQRLSAEMLRDNALAVSGLLVSKVGGPPVKPYQPPGLWKEKSGTAYSRDVGEGSHRRSLYTYWKRTSQPPAMMTFDASNREVCVVKRQVTTTPLQVLVLWNDPQFVEAAYALAEKTMQTQPGAIEQQLQLVFRTLTGRHCTTKELDVLRQMWQEQQEEFASGRSDAAKLLVTGDHRVDVALDANHLAALSIVAQGLMNYDEVVMKR